MRERFEVWVRSRSGFAYFTRERDGSYTSTIVEGCWQAFEAGRALEREAVLTALIEMAHPPSPNTGPDPDPGECSCEKCMALCDAVNAVRARA